MSFQIELDKYDEAYGHFMREVRAAIQETFRQEEERRNLTQSALACELKVDPSVISRRLSGSGNVTLRTICDLYTAMGREPLSNFLVRGEWGTHFTTNVCMNFSANEDQIVVILNPRAADAHPAMDQNPTVWQVESSSGRGKSMGTLAMAPWNNTAIAPSNPAVAQPTDGGVLSYA